MSRDLYLIERNGVLRYKEGERAELWRFSTFMDGGDPYTSGTDTIDGAASFPDGSVILNAYWNKPEEIDGYAMLRLDVSENPDGPATEDNVAGLWSDIRWDEKPWGADTALHYYDGYMYGITGWGWELDDSFIDYNIIKMDLNGSVIEAVPEPSGWNLARNRPTNFIYLDENILYSSNTEGAIKRFDLEAMTELGDIIIPDEFWSYQLAVDGKYIWMCSDWPSELVQIDINTGIVLDKWGSDLGQWWVDNPEKIRADDDRFLYIYMNTSLWGMGSPYGNEQSGLIYRVDKENISKDQWIDWYSYSYNEETDEGHWPALPQQMWFEPISRWWSCATDYSDSTYFLSYFGEHPLSKAQEPPAVDFPWGNFVFGGDPHSELTVIGDTPGKLFAAQDGLYWAMQKKHRDQYGHDSLYLLDYSDGSIKNSWQLPREAALLDYPSHKIEVRFDILYYAYVSPGIDPEYVKDIYAFNLTSNEDVGVAFHLPEGVGGDEYIQDWTVRHEDKQIFTLLKNFHPLPEEE